MDGKPIPRRVSITRHDLRNPLGEIMGFAEILIEEAEEQGQSRLTPVLTEIREAATAMLNQLNLALTLERLQERPESVAELETDICAFSENVARLAESILPVCRAIPDSSFSEDAERIRSSAERLVERTPVLLADMFRAEDADSCVEGDNSNGHRITGETVFLHHPSKSTVSEVTLESDTSVATGGAAILVVDDNESNRALLTRRLSRQGCTVAVAENGSRALELLERHPFDVVLLDIMMPGIDGYQVLVTVKTDARLRHIPVIMISALDDLASLVRCIEAGAEDYLTKPFDPVLLRARIGACLEKKRLRDREMENLALIDEQRRRADELLQVILPRSIAAELKEHNHVKPRHHTNVAVLFSDVTGFTSYCDKHEPEEVLQNLQALVGRCEQISEENGLEKIKTIGDAFMATAGLLEPVENPVLSCVRAGLAMERAAMELPCGWRVHVGIHIGPVIAGVVGAKKYNFDVWGDTVNTAARVAGLAGESGVMLSERAWQDVSEHCQGQSAGRFQVKGKGEMEAFGVTAVD